MAKGPKRNHKRTESIAEPKRQRAGKEPGRDAANPLFNAEYVKALIQRGIEAYQNRQLADAATHLARAVAFEPRNAFAQNCLGVVRRAEGKIPEAITCYEKAIECQPDFVDAHNNLGVALELLGDLERSAECYHAALKLRPNFAAALNNLGNVLTKLRRPEEAVQQLEKALAHNPDFAAAHNNLGLALLRLDRAEEAEACFRTALRFQDKYPEAYVNLGNAVRAKGALDEAASHYQTALALRPNYPGALTGLGNVYFDQRRCEEAFSCYIKAAQTDPRCAEAWFGQGNVYLQLDQLDQAEQSFQRAIHCDPEYAEAFNNLGSVYKKSERLELAEEAFQKAVRVDRLMISAYNNLINVYRKQDRPDLATKAFEAMFAQHPARPMAKLRLSTICPAVFTSRQEMSDYWNRAYDEWTSLAGAFEYKNLGELRTHANEPPFELQFFAEDIRPLKTAYANIFRYVGPDITPAIPTGKIQIGIVVTQGHEIGFLKPIWPLLSRLNRDEFELTLVCDADSVTKFKNHIQDDSTKLLGVTGDTHLVLQAIRDARFDLLYYFEINTDAQNYFLPFFRLAPVQLTTWGIQVTSGIPNVDYYLSSELIEPADAESHYTEQLILSKTLLCYRLREKRPETPKSREAFGFSSSDHLYVCAQQLGKFHPDFDLVLAEILRRDPQGKVIGVGDSHGFGAKRLRERWSRMIPDVADRFVLLPRLDTNEYLSLLLAGDVLLDPIHFGGVSSSYDGFSLSLPIVTCPMRHQRARFTAGCYAKMGLTDLVSTNLDDYVDRAVRWARDRDEWSTAAARIRGESWRLFEDQEAVREHEAIFRELARKGRGA